MKSFFTPAIMCATALVAQSNQHSSPSGDEANSDEQDETIVNTVPNLTLQGADDLTNNLQPQDMKTGGLNPSPKRYDTTRPLPGRPQTVPRGMASPHPCDKAFRESSTSDDAKETAHPMANVRVHRRSHMRATENCMCGGASDQHLQGLQGLLAPPATRLHGEHDEVAPSRGSEFGICRLLVLACLQQDHSIVIGFLWVTTPSSRPRHRRRSRKIPEPHGKTETEVDHVLGRM